MHEPYQRATDSTPAWRRFITHRPKAKCGNQFGTSLITPSNQTHSSLWCLEPVLELVFNQPYPFVTGDASPRRQNKNRGRRRTFDPVGDKSYLPFGTVASKLRHTPRPHSLPNFVANSRWSTPRRAFAFSLSNSLVVAKTTPWRGRGYTALCREGR